MADTIKISQLDAVEEVSASDLFIISAPTSSGYSTNNISVSQLASAIVDDLEYTQELETTSKTIIGAINELNPQREWTLVGTISGDSDDRGNIDDGVTVDMTGKTELYIYSAVRATASSSLSAGVSPSGSGYHYFADIAVNGYRESVLIYENDPLGIHPVCARNASSEQIRSTIAALCWLDGSHIENIVRINFATASAITSCDLKIYAR